MIRRRVLVSGRVQGVFYRDTCRREAAALGVAGWVRNLPDGRVEAVFEGTEETVARMLAWTRTGPPQATVTAVEEFDEPAEGLTGFGVSRAG
ncbi:acylphosphatase [Actinoplanes sp. NPDC023714]|uniref:acylphosphatase n=1 Tax=Actinoplanes sp. NPDC023714 TaxID=3154322 RepID=UPI0033CE0ECE